VPRRNWSRRNGRHRPQGQHVNWNWLVEALAAEWRYRHHPTPQTTDESRRPKKENRP
jgi:hypothetical protein